MSNRFGHKVLVLGAVLGLLAGTGTVRAAENELRLPVEKSVRLTPPPETPPAKPAEAANPEKKPEPAPAAQKGEAPKAEAKKPDVLKSEPAPAAGAKPAPAPKAVAKPKAPEAAPAPSQVKAEPKPEPAPKPKPEPRVDPLALETPPRPQPREALVLPEGGQLVGDVELEFLADRIILRAVTSSQVERVTYFGVTNQSRKLALDLRGPWRKKGGAVQRFDTGPVKAVVAGEHPDRLRLAVEFREGAVAPDMQPKVELGPRGLTVTIPLAVRLKR